MTRLLRFRLRRAPLLLLAGLGIGVAGLLASLAQLAFAGSAHGTPGGGPGQAVGAPADPGPSPSSSEGGSGASGEAPGADPAAKAVLQRAVQGSRSATYRGMQDVTIHGQQGTRTGEVFVTRLDPAHLEIQALAKPGLPSASLVQEGTRRSAVGWWGGAARAAVPVHTDDVAAETNVDQLLRKYRVTLNGQVTMLGRLASALEIDRASDARLVERWTVDDQTGVLLDRESFGDSGAVERSIVFRALTTPVTPTAGPAPAETQAPPDGDGRASRALPQSDLAAVARTVGAPRELPDNFQLRSGSRLSVEGTPVVQLEYSDGLEEVSLFQQPGRMTPATAAPGAHPLALRRESGYAWEGFPRGVTWQAGGKTLTLLGAPPTDELTAMANHLPQAPMRRSVWVRVGQLVHWTRRKLGLATK